MMTSIETVPYRTLRQLRKEMSFRSWIKLQALPLFARLDRIESKWWIRNKHLYNVYLLAAANGKQWNVATDGEKHTVSGTVSGAGAPVTCILRKGSSDLSVFRNVMLNNEYALAARMFARMFGDEPRVIVDAGANIGLATLYFKSLFPSASVICIEPESSNYRALQDNVSVNRLSNLTLVRAGLWNKRCALKVDRGFRDGLEWSARVTEISAAGDGDLEGIGIAELMEQAQVDHIDLFKIDIEGSERVLFDGNYLGRFLDKITCLMIELHPETVDEDEVTAFFLARNYSVLKSGKETLVALNNDRIRRAR